MVLRAADHPGYFRALAAADVIAAHDAHHDPRTRELAAGYLAPLGIGAMLDTPVRAGGQVIGVLCHEHVGQPRQWTADEEIIGVTLASLVSLVLERWERQQAERQFQAVVEAAANAFVLADDQGRIALVNSQAERMFGHLRTAMLGQSVEMLIPERFRAQHSADLARFMASFQARAVGVGRELVGLRADGTEVSVDIGLSPMAVGDRRFVLASLVDITERRRIERLRSAIGLTLSHELNTPLNGILGALDVLGGDAASVPMEDLQDMLDAVGTSATRLHAMVNRNLDFAELELFEPELAPTGTRCDSDGLIRDLAVRVARERQREADLALDLRAGTVAVSERWLTRLLAELLDNAFKFSPAGSPVRVLTRAGPGFELVVGDAGRGMSAQEVGGLGAFIQFGRDRYEQQGIGLGLYLARRIAEAHGGSLSVRSHPGGGTTVTAVLGADVPVH
jgi:PAS domain S-box-containing protein